MSVCVCVCVYLNACVRNIRRCVFVLFVNAFVCVGAGARVFVFEGVCVCLQACVCVCEFPCRCVSVP